MTIELSEKPVSEAVNKLSWQLLEDHLAETALTPKDVEKLVGLIRRNEALVLKRLNQNKQKNRETFLEKLAAYLDDKGYPKQSTLVRSHLTRLNEIDGVYQSILGLLAKSVAAELSPALRVSALLDRSNREYIDLLTQMHQNSTVGRVLDLGKVTLKGEDGNEFSPEAVHELLLTTLASTLGMEAHIHGWYDDEGVLVLPALPATTDRDRFAVGSVQMLAAAWRHWQFSERRHRYLGAPLDRKEDLAPAWAEHGVKRVWDSRPTDDRLELHSYAANARLAERLLQHWTAVISKSHYDKAISGTDGTVELLPSQTISLHEIHGASALGQLLSYEITDDQTEYAGLTLAEWVRGYSILQDVADKALESRDADRLTIRFSDAELVSLLQRLNLKGNKAKIFIGHATYRKASRDLFDQPLIKLQDGGYLLLAISAATSSIPTIILSTLGMLEVNLDGRGKRFEKRMIELLGKHGINAKNIVCERGGEVYDYDVAFVWGGYLFLFECKSRGLSGGDPVRIYFFSLGIRQVVKQVTRLAEGLKQYPDILATYMPEAVGKQVVHCVVNSLPYAMFTEEDAIHFADESGIARFFQQSAIGSRSFSREAGWGAIDPASATAFLWEGAKPTPEDFLRHLRTPIQLVNVVSHLKLKPTQIAVGGEEALQFMDFLRTDWTADSLREAARKAGYRTGGNPAAAKSSP
ncbi:hypothetical protein [Luteimonas mephitis]|uniref:hypothetical protein n=1 Tax=Luteimonas mephitis TaxID=83615 RepID=UPI00047B46B3|nr:hypothetical protein [Luteimonas mephitis]